MKLELKQIDKSFGTGDSRAQVLTDINLVVEAGECCVLTGPSGSGKSTLLNIIGGIEKADAGTIIVGDAAQRKGGEEGVHILEKMGRREMTRYRRDHLGYVFQAYNLIPNLTVAENIEVGAYLSDEPMELEALLSTLGLTEHRDKLPSQLSGGQQQRTAIGRAIIKSPDILLCDEPTGALDYKTSKDILQLIETINEKYGTTVILVTHNTAVKSMATQIVELKDGKIREDRHNDDRIPARELEW